MALAGELLSLGVSLSQQISIMLGVGALTITLAGHLLSLHAHVSETVYGYVRVARQVRALALAAIILSGGVAILIHLQTRAPEAFLAPAFLFKWLLIALLTAFYFVELKAEGYARDAIEGFEGANWYALFIVHTMVPAIAWMLLLSIYFAWLAAFSAVWVVFVWIMRRSSASGFASTAPTPAAPPAKPAPAAAPVPAQIAQKPIEVHPNHSMLPMVAELDLPAPSKVEVPAPKPAPAPAPAPAPMPMQKPAPVQVVPESSRPAVPMPDLDQTDLPALHVMPRRPEDIESSKRGPVVKMSDSE